MHISTLILRTYRKIFARPSLFKFNKLLFQCSLRGMGVLNYESFEISGEDDFLRRRLSDLKRGIVLDVGANIGGYTGDVLDINPNLNVYAFEPHPKTFTKLKENMESRNNVTLINAAVGEEPGTLTIYDYASHDGSSHASLYKDVITK